MNTTITVKRVWRNKGTTKAGKDYLLTKLLAGGKYYTTFTQSSVLSSIAEGSRVELEAEPSDREGYLSIKRIISVDAEASSITRPRQSSAAAAASAFPRNTSTESTKENAPRQSDKLAAASANFGRQAQGFTSRNKEASLPAAPSVKTSSEEVLSRTPAPLTLDDIAGYLETAVAEVQAMEGLKGADDEALAPLMAEYLRGLLQSQSQAFQVAMNALEAEQHDLNYKRWKA